MTAPRFRHVLWDMGGTIVNTYPELDAVLAAVVRSHGHDIDEHDVAVLTRRSTGEAMAALSQRFRIAEAEFESAEDDLKERWRTEPPALMPGLREAMTAVDGLNLVVTHRERRSAEALLRTLSVEVDDLVCTSDGFPRKPDPAMYLEMVRRHGLDPAQCLGVGDRPLDATAAQAAGMAAVMLVTPGIPLAHDADYECNSLGEVIPLLA